MFSTAIDAVVPKTSAFTSLWAIAINFCRPVDGPDDNLGGGGGIREPQSLAQGGRCNLAGRR
ncbi:MAG: hypothetical protein PVH62_07620 [Anaerolineae bacterium]|jgi:hypothetical protein